MHWKVMAALYRLLDRVPHGDRIHYFAQRHLLGTFPISDQRLARERWYADRHATALQERGWKPGEPADALEFGAGRHLAVALSLASQGLSVTATDITALMKPALVRDAAERLGSPLPSAATFEDSLRLSGIEYRLLPPSSFAGIPDFSIDLVYSTSVLEHVPQEQIEPLLRECRRVLRPTGCLSMVVDYQDHYSYGPADVSQWNFLTIDETRWFRSYSPAIHFQNRLRHPEVVELIEQAGFAADVVSQIDADEADSEWASPASLAEPFRSMPAADLHVSQAHIVATPC